jgi:hypothetical protein
MGDTPERERSVPMENVEEVKRKSKEKENRYVQIRHKGRVRGGRLLRDFLGRRRDTIRQKRDLPGYGIILIGFPEWR